MRRDAAASSCNAWLHYIHSNSVATLCELLWQRASPTLSVPRAPAAEVVRTSFAHFCAAVVCGSPLKRTCPHMYGLRCDNVSGRGNSEDKTPVVAVGRPGPSARSAALHCKPLVHSGRRHCLCGIARGQLRVLSGDRSLGGFLSCVLCGLRVPE